MLESFEVFLHWAPLALGGIAVALGALCVGQFFSFQKQAARAPARDPARDLDLESLEVRMAQMSAELEELRERLGEREAERPAVGGWAREVAGVNLNRRGQVLRLRRRGRTVEEIASTLGMPRGEVELMVKVDELSQRVARAGAGGTSSFSVDAR